jgi:hypothetical protein
MNILGGKRFFYILVGNLICLNGIVFTGPEIEIQLVKTAESITVAGVRSVQIQAGFFPMPWIGYL